MLFRFIFCCLFFSPWFPRLGAWSTIWPFHRDLTIVSQDTQERPASDTPSANPSTGSVFINLCGSKMECTNGLITTLLPTQMSGIVVCSCSQTEGPLQTLGREELGRKYAWCPILNDKSFSLLSRCWKQIRFDKCACFYYTDTSSFKSK